MHGTVEVGGQSLEKGDAVTDAAADLPEFLATSDTTLVAFLIDPAAPVSLAGITVDGDNEGDVYENGASYWRDGQSWRSD